MDWMSPITSSLPYMVSVGNHESECHSPYCLFHLESHGWKLNNFTAYNARWHMPSAESNGAMSMWHAFQYAGVRFISLNTETDFPGAHEGKDGDSGIFLLPAGQFAPNGTYMAWVESQLAEAAGDSTVAWIVAGGHRPFSSLPDTYATTLAALFKKYGVALYVAGHAHSYKREEADAWGDGVAHITVGGAGCDEMATPGTPTPSQLVRIELYAHMSKLRRSQLVSCSGFVVWP